MPAAGRSTRLRRQLGDYRLIEGRARLIEAQIQAGHVNLEKLCPAEKPAAASAGRAEGRALDAI
jgi:hypothetical protein